MPLPILQPSSIDTTQIRGDVTIDRSVIIASGVILNAMEGHKIILRPGVCVGMGTIISAYDGNIEIQENTILGSGSLILGHCTIGSQVSLGASVTVYQINIPPMSVIPAGSILGDRSRQIDLKQEEENNSVINGIKNDFPEKIETDILPTVEENISNLSERENQENTNYSEENIQENEEKSSTSEVKENQEADTEILNNDVWEEKAPQVNTVVGQVYINKLLFTLFPEKHNYKSN